ncbi:MAG: hypothetical protein ACRBFS_23030 [Aureispira sp.]
MSDQIVIKHAPVIASALRAEFRKSTRKRTGKLSRGFKPTFTRQFGEISALNFNTKRAAFILNAGLKAGKVTPRGTARKPYNRKKAFLRAEGFIGKAIAAPVEKLATELANYKADTAVNVPLLNGK